MLGGSGWPISRCGSATSRTCATSAIRFMKSSAASRMPKVTATTMSKATVRPRQASSTTTSERGAERTVWITCLASLMFQATSSSRAASEAIGRWPSTGARVSTASSRKSEWNRAANGERAPLRTLVAVRAIAPVAAMPPKKGATRLPRPWATSSASGSWRRRIMASATTAESSDSIAPRKAIAMADGTRARRRAKSKPSGWPSGPGRCQGRRGSGGRRGMPACCTPPSR